VTICGVSVSICGAARAGNLSDAEQIQVNTNGVNVQSTPDIATAPDGRAMVVWRNFSETPSFSSRYKVQGRLYFASGIPYGPDYTLDAETPAGCEDSASFYCRRDDPAVALDGQGGFVVAWSFRGTAGAYPVPEPYDQAILARRFSQFGAPLGPEIVVSATTEWGHGVVAPDVATHAGGGFVVAWARNADLFEPNFEVSARRFDAAGAPLGGPFQVNTLVTGAQTRPRVAATAGGGFLVVWQSAGSAGSDDSGMSIQARRFDPAGVPLGPEFQVNSHTPGHQLRSAVGVDADGDIVIVWESWSSPASSEFRPSIQAQRFAADGTPAGSQFQVNQINLDELGFPALAVEPDGSFLVTWWGADAIWARRFDAAGNALGPDLQVSGGGVATRLSPAVATAPGGEYIVTWASDVGSAGDFLDAIEARRLTADWLFLDGFAAGDLSRWSTSSP
jgi:hypothetical protein